MELDEIIKNCNYVAIYEDLEKVVVHDGKRKESLCKKVYGFNGNLIESSER